MKDDTNKNEKKLNHNRADREDSHGREKIDPLKKKETMEERAKREGWTDIAQSHLGIDE